MEVDTRFGVQEIDPETVIRFPRGLLGFEDLSRFKMFHEEGKPSVFFLQSLDDPEIQFSIANPEQFRVGYQIALDDAEAELLELNDPNTLAVLIILYREAAGEIADSGSPMKASFMAPLLINTDSRVGLQKPLTEIKGFVTIHAD